MTTADPVRGNAAEPARRITDLAYVGVIAATVGLSWVVTVALGGAGQAAPHWFYVPVPIMLAGYRFGPRAAALTSVIVTFAAGPLLPDHFQDGIAVPQAPADWITRGVAFVVLGQAVAWLFRRLRHARAVVSEELAQRRALETDLARQDARFAAMIRRSSDLTTIVSAEGVIDYQSPSSLQLLGSPAEELVGSSFLSLLHPEDRAAWTGALVHAYHHPGSETTIEWRLRRADGQYVPIESRVGYLLDDPAVGGVVLNSRDVSDRHRLEEELRHQAFHDSLTGLANRALFHDRLEQALARLERAAGVLGVLFIDLDEFKAVNDGRGHVAGDELLQAVAHRLRSMVRVGETVARLGGDEFGMLIEGVDPAYPLSVADRIRDMFQLPFMVGGAETYVHASIGIATTSNSLDSAGELLRHADVAMYAAKSAGKNRCQAFHPGLQDQVIGRLQLGADLARTVERDELVIHYQPIFDLRTEGIVGLEALLRWNHPQRGLLLPSEFIGAAESTGHIVDIGRWLLREACREAMVLQWETESPLALSVNLSTRQLDDPHLVSDVKTALAESGMPPGRLTLEITESTCMTDPARSLLVLKQLKSLGVKLSIDDFGTGYSSLAYLQRLPVDELKIDRSFVAATPGGPGGSGSIVDTIISLARSFGLHTVGEGVESYDQLVDLRRAGCDLAQGFLLGKPMEAQRLRRRLADPVPPWPRLPDPSRTSSSSVPG